MAGYSTPHNVFSTPDVKSQLTQPPKAFLYPYHSPSVSNDLIETAQALVYPKGKGIYATDETPLAIEDVLVASFGAGDVQAGLRSEEEKKQRRVQWREAAYKAISSEYISGVILYEETLLDFGQGTLLTNKGIIVGVRANGELTPLPKSTSEFIVQGLDNLLPKLQAARAAGARFSKWRVPIACTDVTQGLPSQTALEVQAETLAQYASISQQAGLVPIVEPDVEFSENATLERSAEVHEKAISLIYDRCKAYGVLLEGTLIKPSFPQPGLKHPSRANVTPEQIAFATATVLSRSVPAAVPGVVFLSGGLQSTVATQWLGTLNQLVSTSPLTSPFSRLPPLSFSFGRALQGDALKHWVKGEHKELQQSFDKWSRACWLAAKGDLEELKLIK